MPPNGRHLLKYKVPIITYLRFSRPQLLRESPANYACRIRQPPWDYPDSEGTSAFCTQIYLLRGLKQKLYAAVQLLPQSGQNLRASQEGGRMDIMAAGVHFPLLQRRERTGGLLPDGKPVDIRPKGNARPLAGAPKQTDYPPVSRPISRISIPHCSNSPRI